MTKVKIILHRIISVVCFTNFPSEIRSLHQPTMMRLNFATRAWDGVSAAHSGSWYSPMIASSWLLVEDVRLRSSLSGLLKSIDCNAIKGTHKSEYLVNKRFVNRCYHYLISLITYQWSMSAIDLTQFAF